VKSVTRNNREQKLSIREEKSFRLCEAFQYVDDIFLDIVERERKAPKKKAKRLPVFISTVAACLCLLLVLPVAAGAYNWFGLRDFLAPKKDTVPQFFDLSAYQESPLHQALTEWEAFLAEYDADKTILFKEENDVLVAEREDWKLYGVYSYEMGQKLDEIADKYGLRLHTGGRTIECAAWEKMVKEVFAAGRSTGDGYLYEDSSFHFAGGMALTGYDWVDFTLVYTRKGIFDNGLPLIKEAADYKGWQYTAACGKSVVLGLSSSDALIYAEYDKCFVTVSVQGGISEAALEELADKINFNALQDSHMSELDFYSYFASGETISLSGFSEGPEAKAFAEWEAFRAGYDVDGSMQAALGNGIFSEEGREDWSMYGTVYTREMGEKLDEIVSRYGLKLHTEINFISGQEMEYRVGGSFLEDCELYGGYIYENGTFLLEGDAALSGCGTVSFQFMRHVKGTFEETSLGIGQAQDYKEWQYLTACGEMALLSLGPQKALIFADFTDCLIVVNVLCGSNEGMTEAALEELADKIDFKVLKEVQVPDMRGDTEVSAE